MADREVNLGAERRLPEGAEAAEPKGEAFEAELAVPVEKPKRQKREGSGDGPA